MYTFSFLLVINTFASWAFATVCLWYTIYNFLLSCFLLQAFIQCHLYAKWRRQWHPTPVLLPGKSHGWRSLVGYSPWGPKESDTTEQLHFHFHFHSTCKLNKQGDNVQPWRTPFLIWNQSAVPCPVLTVASWSCIHISQEAGQVVWCSHLLKNFPQFMVIHTVTVDVFLKLSCFFNNPADVGDLISGSSAFSKASFNIWEFMVHILLKPGLENFEYYFASVWDEGNCLIVWAFFGIAFLWDWNENWPFPVLWPLLSFPNLLTYCVQLFHSFIF